MDVADDGLHAWTLPDWAGTKKTASAGPGSSGIGGVGLGHSTSRWAQVSSVRVRVIAKDGRNAADYVSLGKPVYALLALNQLRKCFPTGR